MDCDICGRNFNQRRKASCASCAKATLYQPRLRQATVLLDREKEHTHVEAILRPGNDGVLAALPEDADWDVITAGVKKQSNEKAKADTEAICNRISGISAQTSRLRQQIEEHKAYITERQRENELKRKEIAANRDELEHDKLQSDEPVQHAIRKTQHRLERTHNKAANARAYLCRQTALLVGLKQRRRRTRDGSIRDDYILGGVHIPDLRDLNSFKPEATSAALDHVCHLLGLCCHYLSVRLPAELLLPHAGFPHAVMLQERESHKGLDLSPPASSVSNSSSPSASRFLERQAQSKLRSRLLHLDRTLAKLYKDDSKGFRFFVEAISLLAWDVAWLCKTQGIDNINTFEDVCDIGHNLHQLLLGREDIPTKRPDLNRNVSTATDVTTRSNKVPFSEPSAHLGSFSHANAHHNLASSEGSALLRDWKILPLHRLSDKLSRYLLAEMSSAEAQWEVLDGAEWNDGGEDEEEAVLVDGGRRSLEDKDPTMSIMTVAPHDGREAADGRFGAAGAQAKGEKGWMKVRGRNGET